MSQETNRVPRWRLVLGGRLGGRGLAGYGGLDAQTVILEGDPEINRPEGAEQPNSFCGHAWLSGVSEYAGFVGLEFFVPGIFSTPRALKLGLPNVKMLGEGVLFAKLHAPFVEGMEVAP